MSEHTIPAQFQYVISDLCNRLVQPCSSMCYPVSVWHQCILKQGSQIEVLILCRSGPIKTHCWFQLDKIPHEFSWIPFYQKQLNPMPGPLNFQLTYYYLEKFLSIGRDAIRDQCNEILGGPGVTNGFAENTRTKHELISVEERDVGLLWRGRGPICAQRRESE